MRIDSAGTIWKMSYFRGVPKGEEFHCNGNRWKKQSTRTARLVSPARLAGPVFYFRATTVCESAYKESNNGL